MDSVLPYIKIVSERFTPTRPNFLCFFSTPTIDIEPKFLISPASLPAAVTAAKAESREDGRRADTFQGVAAGQAAPCSRRDFLERERAALPTKTGAVNTAMAMIKAPR